MHVPFFFRFSRGYNDPCPPFSGHLALQFGVGYASLSNGDDDDGGGSGGDDDDDDDIDQGVIWLKKSFFLAKMRRMVFGGRGRGDRTPPWLLSVGGLFVQPRTGPAGPLSREDYNTSTALII